MRSDWNQYLNAGTNNKLATDRVKEGSSSLKCTDTNSNTAEILAKSETDSPTEGRIQTEVNAQVDEGPAFYFRYQDANNYYVARWGDYSSADIEFAVRKVVGGAGTSVGQDTIATNSNPLFEDSWVPGRVTAWVDSSGDFRFRLEHDNNRDGTWSARANDIVDTTPDLGTGGGIGVGTTAWRTPNSYDVWFDQTEVFY